MALFRRMPRNRIASSHLMVNSGEALFRASTFTACWGFNNPRDLMPGRRILRKTWLPAVRLIPIIADFALPSDAQAVFEGVMGLALVETDPSEPLHVGIEETARKCCTGRAANRLCSAAGGRRMKKGCHRGYNGWDDVGYGPPQHHCYCCAATRSRRPHEISVPPARRDERYRSDWPRIPEHASLQSEGLTFQ